MRDVIELPEITGKTTGSMNTGNIKECDLTKKIKRLQTRKEGTLDVRA